jgi:hypothetical protein
MALACALSHQIPKLRMPAQKIHHKAAAGDDLAAVRADQLQRALYQLRRNAAPAQRPRRLGVGDDDRARRAAIIRKRKPALDVELEAGEGGVVADGGHERSISSTAILAHVDVDVEVDLRDAALLALVRTAFMPAPVAGAGVADIGELEAPPLRELARALAAELPRQHDLLAILVGADDMGTQFAAMAAVAAGHLLLGEDGVAEEGVGGRGHGRSFENRATQPNR